MPTVTLPGTDSPSITSYSTPGSAYYVYSQVTLPLGRQMANGSRNIYVQSLNLYVAGRSGTTRARAYFASAARGSYGSYAAQSTPSKKALSVGLQAAGGSTQRYGCYTPGSEGGLNFRRGGSGSTTASSGTTWGSSLSGTLTYAEAPPAPTPLGVDQPTPTTLRVRFSSNGNGGSGVTGWSVQFSTSSSFPSGSSTKTVTTSSGTVVVTGLAPDTTYYFRVAGRNIVTDNAGTTGPRSSTFSGKTSASTPGAPRNLTHASAGPTATKLTWQAPASNGGSAITGYQVQYADNASFTGATTTSVGNVLTWTSPSLGTGTHYLRVRAVNANGNGTWSGAVSTTVTRSGYFTVRAGDEWSQKPVKVYSGGTWVMKPVKHYRDGEWVTPL